MKFVEQKSLHIDSNFIKPRSNWQDVFTGSSIGLVQNRKQAITWTTVDQAVWHHMASLGHNELKFTRDNLQFTHRD